MSDVSMRILLSAVGGASVTSVIGQVANSLGSGGLKGALLGVGLAAGGLAIGLGVTAVKAASDFQSSLAKVQAYAGYTQQQTQDMGNSILKMAPQLGEAPKALADALYMVASAGFKGKDSLQILTAAGQTAAASNSDATVVTKALVGSLNALQLGAGQSGNIMDELNSTVSQGLLTWGDYGAVVGKIAGSVSVAGGSATQLQNNFKDLNAALDVYSNSTVSAHQASMWLSADMSLLDGKTSTLDKNAKKLGISFNESQFKSMDFAKQLQYLNTVTGGNHDKLVALLGGNSTVANSVQFLNNQYSTLKGTIDNISGSMQNGKTTQDKFATAQQTLAFKGQQASAAFQSLMITLGTALLPVISNIVGAVTPAITGFTNWLTSGNHLQNILNTVGSVIQGVTGFVGGLVTGISNVVSWFQKNHDAATLLLIPLGILGTLMANMAAGALENFLATLPELIVGFGSWAAGAWTAAAGTIAATWPLLALGAAIGAVIAIVILLVTHWKQVSAFAVMIWGHIAQFFQDDVAKPIGNLFNALGTTIHDALAKAGQFFSDFGKSIHDQLNDIIKWFQDLPGSAVKEIQNLVTQGQKLFQDFWNNVVKDAKSIFSNLGDDIGKAFKSTVDFLLINPVNGIIDGINRVTGVIHIPAIPHIPQLAMGGTIASGGLALVGENGAEVVSLPTGSTVYPHGTGPGGAGGPSYYFTIYLSTMARSQSEVRNLVDMVEQELGRRVRNQASNYASGGIF